MRKKRVNKIKKTPHFFFAYVQHLYSFSEWVKRNGRKKLLSTPQKEVKSESEFRNKKNPFCTHTIFSWMGDEKNPTKAKQRRRFFSCCSLSLPLPCVLNYVITLSLSLLTAVLSACTCKQLHEWGQMWVVGGWNTREEKIHSITATQWMLCGTWPVFILYCNFIVDLACAGDANSSIFLFLSSLHVLIHPTRF